MLENTANRPSGMRAFTIIWLGQFLSMIGTGMSRFALTLWAWEMTGQATSLALVAFFGFLPMVLFSPIAGALVDRWNRKLVMMFSDLATGAVTIVFFLLSLAGQLQIEHIYIGVFFAGIFESFQFPAYSAAISTMVDKSQYGRTSAMLGVAGEASGIFAPIAGAALYPLLKLHGIFLIDILSFSFAIGALLFVYIPQTPVQATKADGTKNSLWEDSLFGFKYIYARPSLFGLQLVFFFGNFLSSMVFTLTGAMILARTGNNQDIFAFVNVMFGIGGLVGGVAMSVWGGFKKPVNGVLLGWILSGMFGTILLGLGQGVVIWGLGAFLGTFVIPLVNASNQAIWQSKVPPQLQGRVFSIRRLIAQVVSPLAMLISGPLADKIFEPMMMNPESALYQTFGGIVGTGRGAGMGLMFLLFGVGIVIVGLSAYLFPAVRNVDALIPDHEFAHPTPEPEK